MAENESRRTCSQHGCSAFAQTSWEQRNLLQNKICLFWAVDNRRCPQSALDFDDHMYIRPAPPQECLQVWLQGDGYKIKLTNEKSFTVRIVHINAFKLISFLLSHCSNTFHLHH
eukprot:g9228.t1